MKFLKTAFKDVFRGATVFAVLFLGYNNSGTIKESLLDVWDYITSRKSYDKARGWALLCLKMARWTIMLTMAGLVSAAIMAYFQQDGPSRLFGNTDPRLIFGLTFDVGAVMLMLVMVTAKIAQGAAKTALRVGEATAKTAWRLLPETLFGRPSEDSYTESVSNELEEMTNSVLSASLGYLTMFGIILLSGMIKHPDNLIAFIPLVPMAMIWSLVYSRKRVIVKIASATVIVVGVFMTISSSAWREFKTTEVYQELTSVKQDAIGRIAMGKETGADRSILGSKPFENLVKARDILFRENSTACDKKNAEAYIRQAKAAALKAEFYATNFINCAELATAQAKVSADKKKAETEAAAGQKRRSDAAARVMNYGKVSPSDRTTLGGVVALCQQYYDLNKKPNRTECEQGKLVDLHTAINASVNSGKQSPAQVRFCAAVAQNGGGSRGGNRLTEEQIAKQAYDMTLRDLDL